MNGNALELGNAYIRVTSHSHWALERVSSWGSADPAGEAEISHWLSPDHCILLESCTKNRFLCLPTSVSGLRFCLSSSWASVQPLAFIHLRDCWCNCMHIFNNYSAAQLQDFPPKESLVHQNQWWISQWKLPTSSPGFGRDVAVWQQVRPTAGK